MVSPEYRLDDSPRPESFTSSAPLLGLSCHLHPIIRYWQIIMDCTVPHCAIVIIYPHRYKVNRIYRLFLDLNVKDRGTVLVA